MYILNKLKSVLIGVIQELEIDRDKSVYLEHPNDLSHGDFATNIAMVLSKDLEKNPREIAEKIKQKFLEKKISEIESVEVAGPGFINIKLSKSFFEQVNKETFKKGMEFGNLDIWEGKTILIEHSSPNLFKPFHIGHMMNNAIGETMARLCYLSGADTKVISYPSDVSLGIGKAVWQLMEYGIEKLNSLNTISEKMAFLGKCYTDGTNAMKDNPDLEIRIREITQDIYEHRDTTAYEIYKIGRDLNLQYFITMTARLGSVFDGYIFESEAGNIGKEIVKENTPTVYTESNGAIIFEPNDKDLEEDKSLHTRVFINKEGNPTYEAKDTGLLKLKFDRYDPDLSIFVTDSEQGPYFNVVSYAAGKINQDWRNKTHHMTHGRMKFKGQKMSSRLGNTPIVSDILDVLNDSVFEKTNLSNMTEEQADIISIAALKYSILRAQPGKNIDFDPDTSLSFEGDSGPYLQYTYARCQSILKKANDQGIKICDKRPENWETLDLEKMLYRLPGIFESAFLNYAPQMVTSYVKDITQLFNSWYGSTKIINKEDCDTCYRLFVVSITAIVIKKALWSLGIDVLDHM